MSIYLVYLWQPVWLHFDFIAHAYLIGLTPLIPAWLRFKILWKLRSVWITFFLPEGLSKAFIECKTPFFHSVLLFQIRKTYAWCNVPCNVWFCMNEMSDHLNLFFFIWICFILLFRIYYSSCRYALHGLALLICYVFFSFFWKGVLRPNAFLLYHNFLCARSLNVVILWFIVGSVLDLPPFFRVGF